MKVDTCIECGRSFWATDTDNGICLSCFRKIPVQEVPIKTIRDNYQISAEERAEALRGYIYILKSSNGYYKIGRAADVSKRVAAWKTIFPVKINMIHSFACKNYTAVENALHNKYAKKRAQREWYRLNKEDVNYLLSIKDYELG